MDGFLTTPNGEMQVEVKRMKLNITSAIVLVLIVAITVFGAGFYAGGGGASSQTTTTTSTQYSTTTITTESSFVQNLTMYWKQAASAKPWSYYQLSRAQLVPLLNAKNSSIYLLDVRQPTGTGSYSVGHIAGAINIPFQNITAALLAGSIPTDKIVICICYTGQTATQTMVTLRELGFTAFNLSSGMSGWNNATRVSASAPMAMGENYPIVTGTAPGTWTVFNP